MLFGIDTDPDDLVGPPDDHEFVRGLMERISSQDGFAGWAKDQKTDHVTVYSGFLQNADRYLFDARICRRSKGWKQYDTTQDAWYFGVWVHQEEMVVVTYAEGDIVVKTAANKEAFKQELEEMDEFYGDPPPAAYSVDSDGTITEYYDKRPDGGEDHE